MDLGRAGWLKRGEGREGKGREIEKLARKEESGTRGEGLIRHGREGRRESDTRSTAVEVEVEVEDRGVEASTT